MKKTALYLTFFLIINSSFQNINNYNYLEGKWIAIKGLYLGGILDITPSSITFISIIKNKTTKHKYKIDQNHLVIYRNLGHFKTLGKIIDISTDRFKLVSDKSDTIEFFKLKKFNNDIPPVNISLKNTSWNLRLKNITYRIDFGDQLFFNEKSTSRKALLQKPRNQPYRENVFWVLKEYKNNQILYISDACSEPIINIIKGTKNNRIDVKTFISGDSYEGFFEKIPKVSDNKKQETITFLTSKKWILTDFDTIHTGEGQILFKPQNINSLLNIKDLKTNNISYKFYKNGKFDYKLNDSIFKTYNWFLSDDCRFIWTSSNPTAQCIEIERINKNELIINKIESIYIKGKNTAPECMVKLKLK